MKKVLATTVTVMIFVFIAQASIAQQAQEETTNQYPSKKWVSAKGYWVMESNIKTPKEQIVFYYNNNDVLVYKQTVSGTELKIKRRAVKMQLKKILETSVIAWEKKEENNRNNLTQNK